MFDIRKKSYAQVILQKGIALKAGQTLFMDIPVEQREFAQILTEEAYVLGAGNVVVIWRDVKVEALRVKYCGEKGCPYTFPFPDERYLQSEIASHEAAFLRIDSPDFETLPGLSAEQAAAMGVESRRLSMAFRSNPNSHTCVACVPNSTWAQKVFPDKNPEIALRQLWETIFQCCRINTPDPLQAWEDYIHRTKARKRRLNERKYRSLRYKSARTELQLDLVSSEEWFGGYMDTPSGQRFIPNIPTEEIFTVPDKRTANGWVGSTLPLNYQGHVIGPFVLYFKDGAVVDFHCENGADVLREILETDAGSCRLGEVALVDQDSPIAQVGKIFYTTLYDENASCHLALGMGGAPFLPEEERDRLGLNTSVQHVDFMIGSDDMRIEGLCSDGTWEDVFVNGHWAAAFQLDDEA